MSSYDLRFAKSNADITTFEQDFEDHIVSTRSFSVTANAFVAFTDKVLTARDPGQLIIEDGNYTSGRDSILDFRMIMADATTLEFKGSVTIGSMGGDVNAGTA